MGCIDKWPGVTRAIIRPANWRQTPGPNAHEANIQYACHNFVRVQIHIGLHAPSDRRAVGERARVSQPVRDGEQKGRPAMQAISHGILDRWHLARREGPAAGKAADVVGVPRSTLLKRDRLRRQGRLEPRSRRPRRLRWTAWSDLYGFGEDPCEHRYLCNDATHSAAKADLSAALISELADRMDHSPLSRRLA